MGPGSVYSTCSNNDLKSCPGDQPENNSFDMQMGNSTYMYVYKFAADINTVYCNNWLHDATSVLLYSTVPYCTLKSSTVRYLTCITVCLCSCHTHNSQLASQHGVSPCIGFVSLNFPFPFCKINVFINIIKDNIAMRKAGQTEGLSAHAYFGEIGMGMGMRMGSMGLHPLLLSLNSMLYYCF
jgi:hypothetical protein